LIGSGGLTHRKKESGAAEARVEILSGDLLRVQGGSRIMTTNIQTKDKTQRVSVPTPTKNRPRPDSPNDSAWCRRLRGPISPLSGFHSACLSVSLFFQFLSHFHNISSSSFLSLSFCDWGVNLRSKSFHYHNHHFSLFVVVI